MGPSFHSIPRGLFGFGRAARFFVFQEFTKMESTNILTVSDVAVILRCSKAHVCNAINGKIRGVTPLGAISMGRRKLVRRATLEAWLSQNEPDAMILASSGIDAVGASKG
jgi:hypothetical protein